MMIGLCHLHNNQDFAYALDENTYYTFSTKQGYFVKNCHKTKKVSYPTMT